MGDESPLGPQVPTGVIGSVGVGVGLQLPVQEDKNIYKNQGRK